MAETDQECLNEEDTKLSNEQTYDAALASMLSKLKNYIIPLINEVFGEKYTDRAEVVLRNNKHVIHRTDGTLARRDSDSVIDLSENPILKISKSYLFECEAWYDKTIVVRINEYDTSVTIENAQLTDEGVILTHPHSAIIFLHPSKNIPQKMKITHRGPCGEEMSYYVSTLQIKDYSADDIFRKKLYILLPFHLFRYANELKEIETNETRRKELSETLIDINKRLEAAKKQGDIGEYQMRLIQELLLRVSDRLLAGFQTIKKEVDSIMSRVMLRTKADVIFEQGEEKGREEGREEGQNDLFDLINFLIRHGRNEDVLKVTSNRQVMKDMLTKFRSGELAAACT